MNAQGEEFFTTIEDAGIRLDVYVAARMPEHVSRSRVQQIIKTGGLLINGQPCHEPKRKLSGEECIQLEIPEAEASTVSAEAIELDILHEDDDLIVINKPAGMVTHPAVGNWSGTLVNALLHHCGETLSGIGGVKRPGIVHRLDKDTSGVLVVAKNDRTHVGLAEQFADHGKSGPLERAYLALVWGKPPLHSGMIDVPLGRSSTNRRKRAVVSPQSPDAKHAITHYKVLENYVIGEKTEAMAAKVRCELETGRTHQIRVHLSHIGHPLIGDQDYGKHFQTKENRLPERIRSVVVSFERQALHASVLGFSHPTSGETLRFEAPPPKDFLQLETAFRLAAGN